MTNAPKGKKLYVWTVLIPWKQANGEDAISRFRMTSGQKIDRREAKRILRTHIKDTLGITAPSRFLSAILRDGFKGWI